MNQTKEITVKPERLAYANGLMAKGTVNLADYDLPKFENIETWTATFPNGISADIKLNTSGDDVWCEGVLFDKNNLEIACTDVMDKLDGEYVWSVGSDTYKVIVK